MNTSVPTNTAMRLSMLNFSQQVKGMFSTISVAIYFGDSCNQRFDRLCHPPSLYFTCYVIDLN